ncbi:hypothetical protein B4119_1583 [Parageobacillus caldoxylosilyticus]|uniref:Uncharacterized protein n=1 Tax=Saccharococcus caldoxylosilyticus TaxID=81408 RepID=A0A150M4D0_9BACL|nr:hypothetical protein B4119_1583 [Parageobacillus caldoxylosilyticus]
MIREKQNGIEKGKIFILNRRIIVRKIVFTVTPLQQHF